MEAGRLLITKAISAFYALHHHSIGPHSAGVYVTTLGPMNKEQGWITPGCWGVFQSHPLPGKAQTCVVRQYTLQEI